MEPSTIPAIAPFDRPESWWLLLPPALLPAALLFAAAVEVLFDVDEGKRGGTEVKVGSVTPGHLLVTFAPSQQVSVALGELVAQ